MRSLRNEEEWEERKKRYEERKKRYEERKIDI